MCVCVRLYGESTSKGPKTTANLEMLMFNAHRKGPSVSSRVGLSRSQRSSCDLAVRLVDVAERRNVRVVQHQVDLYFCCELFPCMARHSRRVALLVAP